MKKIILMICFMIGVANAETGYIETQLQKRNGNAQGTISLEGRCGFDPSIPFIVGSYATNPPFSWVDVDKNEQGEPVYKLQGYNIDFIKKISSDLKISFRSRAFRTDAEAISALQRGEISAFVGAYYDPKFRQAGFTYVTPAYFQNVIGTVTLKNRGLDLQKPEDLKGLKGAVRLDERFYSYIRLGLPNDLNIQEVPDSKSAFKKLLTGEVDYLLASPYSAEAEARRFKMNTDIKVKSLIFPAQGLFIVINSYNNCKSLAPMISKYLKKKNTEKNERVQNLIQYIDDWGLRFKDKPGLEKELGIEEKKDAEKTEKSDQSEINIEKTELNPQTEQK